MSRGNSGFGPSPISFNEMESWSRLTRTPLAHWEVSILKQMDATYLRVASEMQEKYHPTKGKK